RDARLEGGRRYLAAGVREGLTGLVVGRNDGACVAAGTAIPMRTLDGAAVRPRVAGVYTIAQCLIARRPSHYASNAKRRDAGPDRNGPALYGTPLGGVEIETRVAVVQALLAFLPSLKRLTCDTTRPGEPRVKTAGGRSLCPLFDLGNVMNDGRVGSQRRPWFPIGELQAFLSQVPPVTGQRERDDGTSIDGALDRRAIAAEVRFPDTVEAFGVVDADSRGGRADGIGQRATGRLLHERGPVERHRYTARESSSPLIQRRRDERGGFIESQAAVPLLHIHVKGGLMTIVADRARCHCAPEPFFGC